MSVLTIIPSVLGSQGTVRPSAGSHIDLALQGHTLVASLANHDDVPLTVHARSFTLESTPSTHTVGPHRELKAAWQCPEGFDLSLHGPFGGYRHIEGRHGEPQLEVRLRASRRGGRATLFNPHRFELRALVADGVQTDRSITLAPFTRRTLAVRHQQGGYEVTITLPGTSSRQVLAGHL
ncbi:phospholipase domain-containing protein [Luteococcus peritonei]|uniref:Phospholipase domain-containing protein n=1 Tax=Luteococcus peritonei TaxID=88874 RepID=A0ABW4RVN3_9ACTN